MDIEINEVKEIIKNLEGSGELSIKEEKYLKVAKLCVQLAAENVALKNVFGPGDAVLNFLTIALRHTTYDQIDLDDVTLAFKMSLPETPATDRIVAGIKADGVEEFIGRLKQCVDDGYFVGDEVAVIVGAIDCGKEFCEQLREGADK